MKKLKMKNEEITQLLDADVVSFPKYATQLINLANQNAQGTRPEISGGDSETCCRIYGKILQDI
jgi:hypothetical protein